MAPYLFCENHDEIAKKRPLSILLTVPNGLDFPIFKTPRSFKFGYIVVGEVRAAIYKRLIV